MKKNVIDFLKRGAAVSGGGPIVWGIVYAILNACGAVEVISVGKMAFEVISVTLLAFIAGGISIVYQIEKLPLTAAFLIHALVLYLAYIVIYLINGWLSSGIAALLIFTGCFVVGFTAIWLTVYLTTKKSANDVNERLESVQFNEIRE